uniref:Myosin essential light chain, striated adductor muscle n=1 Tax=Magallana gigas TaxID=29159 RepID=K1RH05_MAGGI
MTDDRATVCKLSIVAFQSKLSKEEIEEAKEVFELFDFWDGRDAEVDASKIGDVIRCVGLNPTLEIVRKNGGTDKMGEKSYKFEEFLPIHETIMNTLEQGTFADYMEAFKTFDREGQGYISGAELRHLLSSLEFIKKVMAGPYPD